MANPRRSDPGATPRPALAADRAITARGPLAAVEDALTSGYPSTALRLAEQLIENAELCEEASHLADRARAQLRDAYLKRLGDLGRTPRVLVAVAEIPRLSLDPRSAFVLSVVDGHTCMHDILDLVPFAELETLRLLVELLEGGVLMV